MDATRSGYERDGAYFTSILGTLSHILLADRVWLDRIEGQPCRYERLDETLHDHLPDLWEARHAEDKRILSLCDGLNEAALLRDLSYRTVAGLETVTRLDRVLTHFFNHQTHHRGQAHALLYDAGMEPPPLDYIYYLRTLGRR